MLKLSFFVFIFCINLFALDVLITKEALKYEEKINPSELRLIKVNQIKKSCIPLTLSEIQNNQYITAHYINKNSILCQRNVKIYQQNSVVFKFGALEIEKKGKIIFENDEFIRIKKDSGEIEKIYKDGRLQ